MSKCVENNEATFEATIGVVSYHGGYIERTRNFLTNEDDLNDGKLLIEGQTVYINKVCPLLRLLILSHGITYSFSLSVAWNFFLAFFLIGTTQNFTISNNYDHPQAYLASFSDYFRALFFGGFKEETEDVCKLENVKLESFILLLRVR